VRSGGLALRGQGALLDDRSPAGYRDYHPSAHVPTPTFSAPQIFFSPIFFDTPIAADMCLRPKVIEGILIDEWLQTIVVALLTTETNGCWKWNGFHDNKGYGLLHVSGTQRIAVHRLTYQLWRDPIPETLVSDHLCAKKWCANPWHIELVTNGENVRRGDHSGPGGLRRTKDTCVHGHPLTEQNTRIVKKATGTYQRRCRICANQWLRDYYARQKVQRTP
jgi:hypothetical protein